MDTIELMLLENGMYQIEITDRLGVLVYVGRPGTTIDSAEKSIIDYMFIGRNINRRKVRESLRHLNT